MKASARAARLSGAHAEDDGDDLADRLLSGSGAAGADGASQPSRYSRGKKHTDGGCGLASGYNSEDGEEGGNSTAAVATSSEGGKASAAAAAGKKGVIKRSRGKIATTSHEVDRESRRRSWSVVVANLGDGESSSPAGNDDSSPEAESFSPQKK